MQRLRNSKPSDRNGEISVPCRNEDAPAPGKGAGSASVPDAAYHKSGGNSSDESSESSDESDDSFDSD